MKIENITEYQAKFYEKHGIKPKKIPMTVEEIAEIQATSFTCCIPVASSPASVYGMDIEPEAKAEYIRSRRLDVPVSQYIHEYSIDDALMHNSELLKRQTIEHLVARMRSHILTDKTKITVTVECDAFSLVKKFFRLTKWWKIKVKHIEIDCSVLYPLCKVTFPHNKQTFHASVAKCW